jgi:hypothetical protein
MSIPTHKKVSRFFKGVFRTVGNTAGGDNKVGEVLHGVLDWLPLPNQPLGKLVKAVLTGNWVEAKTEIGKILTVRNGVALAITIPIVLGWITIEDLKNFVDVFGQVSELMSKI